MRATQVCLVALFAIILTACDKAPTSSSDVAASADSSDVAAASTDSSDVTASADSNGNIQSDERLGTVWGDEIHSVVDSVIATRKSAEPILTISIRYADKAFHGKSLNQLSMMGGKISMSINDDNGKPYPITRENQNYYLSAKKDKSYTLTYQNHTEHTYEIVSSVDGIDVLTGDSASVYHSGYVLYPHGTLNIEGFRKSDTAVASFTFGTPADSYANHNIQGDINNTGIIGTAVYELDIDDKQERRYAPEPTNKPNAFPAG